jgi:hypothetical protein
MSLSQIGSTGIYYINIKYNILFIKSKVLYETSCIYISITNKMKKRKINYIYNRENINPTERT